MAALRIAIAALALIVGGHAASAQPSNGSAYPLSHGEPPSGPTTIVATNTTYTLFQAGEVYNSFWIQNMSLGTALTSALVIDFCGGTYAAPICPELLPVGAGVSTGFRPANNVNVWSSSTGSFLAGKY